MLPSLRAPVWPLRPTSATSLSRTPRPFATALPSANAVPDGASTLLL